ncbi:type IV secretion system protein VirB10 [Thalassospira xiamenensis M-5 = DSM 17429]|uniref:Conjugal transfer protein trbI n=1 Tax=Thalassospira xiamenensis M-5 = DSM 17429 TaxID=1123366 RepID=A0AB72UFI4_9PROT|nr:TrbI/VirB10 family protein [Thalassospira xiamenensis]AJD52952.1 conjugal transfer protein trbI [Thalassospira xiamenensis M-5 = DSM 17429]SIT19567.1 type IV secretion system protein VirB10 [Thalassospira xiamenensis M-5 = DSM 17429]
MTDRSKESFELRGRPDARIVRFRRSIVIGVTALGSGALLGIAMMALQTPSLRQDNDNDELYHARQQARPDQLENLPKDYSEIKQDVPKLGPPLPGDLGRPIVAAQRAQGMDVTSGELSLAEQRQAQQAIDARESGVFFSLANAVSSEPSNSQASENRATVNGNVGSIATGTDPNAVPDERQRKLDFMRKYDDGGIYNPHVMETPVSPWQVMAGSIIPASLVTGINSDLPGLIIAQVGANVYDTVTGMTVLIPQGARLIGTYDSVVAFGQSRALVVWQRILMPDGTSIRLDNMPASDASGYAGLEDEVDYHTWQLLKGISMATLLGVGTELTLGSDESDLVRAIRESTQQNVDQAGRQITEKNLNIQPTIKIRPGWPVRVIVQRDLVLKPYGGEQR